ncbi:uncharacterized protein F4807DRAFT_466219 [Annulohypoxylon truncatum]|uniref:uncharacterized protein n=1 Tax=Annulohypoxylon truncatum TaxID=327061 RepID=UPI002007881F|nr:uncharacterized protein F4807DRAFT_466219 [Annulohypoxylon truncatum]KAI1214728.1 hypothetical protein F4807DRAFT_466219 [Annulohypoxylon truncatum]
MDPSGLTTDKDHQLDQERIGDIFRSGQFSDITVICEDAKWKLHKVILVSRCPWFKRELVEKDPEGEINEIIIASDKDIVGWIIKWIYFKCKLHPANSVEAYLRHSNRGTAIDGTIYNTGTIAYPRLYRAAWRFELSGLMLKIELGMKAYLRQKAIQWQRAFHDTDPLLEPQFLPDNEIDTIQDAIVQTYKYEVDELKVIWVDFAEATMFWPVASGFFKPIFDDVPAYADEVLSYMTDRRYIPAVLKAPHHCKKCHQCPFMHPARTCYYVRVWHDDEGEIVGECNFCTTYRPSLFFEPDE